MRRLHLPTDRLALELVLRFLIEELGVQPRRDDWSHQLREGEDYFRLHRSWPGPYAEPSVGDLVGQVAQTIFRKRKRRRG